MNEDTIEINIPLLRETYDHLLTQLGSPERVAEVIANYTRANVEGILDAVADPDPDDGEDIGVAEVNAWFYGKEA